MSVKRTDSLRKPIPTDLLLCQSGQFMQRMGCPLARVQTMKKIQIPFSTVSTYESVRLVAGMRKYRVSLGGKNGN